MKYIHITLQDRESIEIHLNRWKNQKKIVQILLRSESSISREIKRDSVKKKSIFGLKSCQIIFLRKFYLYKILFIHFFKHFPKNNFSKKWKKKY